MNKLLHFTGIRDVPDPDRLVRRAMELRAAVPTGPKAGPTAGKTLVLLFFQPSLRTRLSTEKAAYNLGMQVISMDADKGWRIEFEEGAVMRSDRAEHVREAAGVISQYADVIGIRTFAGLTDRAHDYSEHVLRQFQRYATVPVLSLESATLHPLQSLADAVTIESHRPGHRPKVVLTWAPHISALPQAVANSFLEWMRTRAVDLWVAQPPEAALHPAFTEGLTLSHDQDAALEGADFVYAKNWSAYEDYGKIVHPQGHWMITPEKMARTRQAKFMHCLPVRRNVVVADAVLDHPDSLVLEQAANREFAAQAVLEALLAGA
ncbi:MAG: hypothetical protein RLY31_2852 [Bacteroidota bacterium]|jgi:N-succinyl-L-ornithine transcarbamylase